MSNLEIRYKIFLKPKEIPFELFRFHFIFIEKENEILSKEIEGKLTKF